MHTDFAVVDADNQTKDVANKHIVEYFSESVRPLATLVRGILVVVDGCF